MDAGGIGKYTVQWREIYSGKGKHPYQRASLAVLHQSDITDTGIGIAEEHYNDIFQRFYRAEEVSAQEGVGLGLYLTQTILNKQRGYITVKSKPGQGSTFSVYLLSGMEDGKRT